MGGVAWYAPQVGVDLTAYLNQITPMVGRSVVWLVVLPRRRLDRPGGARHVASVFPTRPFQIPASSAAVSIPITRGWLGHASVCGGIEDG